MYITPDKQKKVDIKHKTFAFNVSETKEMETEKGRFGIVKGYVTTYGNVDRGNDVVMPGAFANSVQRHKNADNRMIRMYFQHDRMSIIGGFPITKVKDEPKGLYVEGEINLDVQRGFEAYALAKQGVLSDFSIGYSINDADVNEAGILVLKDLELWEASLVTEPMNSEAVVTEVKNAKAFLTAYYKESGIDSPFDAKVDAKNTNEQKELGEIESIKDVENFLKEPFPLSGSNRKILISKIKSFSRDVEDEKCVREVRENVASRLKEHEISKRLDKINNLLK